MTVLVFCISAQFLLTKLASCVLCSCRNRISQIARGKCELGGAQNDIEITLSHTRKITQNRGVRYTLRYKKRYDVPFHFLIK